MRRTARRTSRRTARRVNRRQAMYAEPTYADPVPQEPAYAPAPAPAAQPSAEDDLFEDLKKLGELHAQGILTDEEFAAQKAKILGS